MKTLIINKADLSIASQYDGEPNQGNYGGPWGSNMLFEHVACPEELDSNCVKAEIQLDALTQENKIVVIADVVKLQVKLDQQRQDKLDKLRKLRDLKLVKVDQLVNIAVLDAWTAADKAELKTYRQALLNITELYKVDISLLDSLDIAIIVWPTEPLAK